MPQEAVRVQVRVRPGASRTRVGGAYGEGCLVVAVSERAVDGKATKACLRAVADAFGVPRAAVRLVSGASSRTKLLELDGDAQVLRGRLAELLSP